jgi:hypothetical protein
MASCYVAMPTQHLAVGLPRTLPGHEGPDPGGRRIGDWRGMGMQMQDSCVVQVGETVPPPPLIGKRDPQIGLSWRNAWMGNFGRFSVMPIAGGGGWQTAV